MVTNRFVLRPGCHLKREPERWALVDELRQVEVPINESAHDLLSAIENKVSFSGEEMEFLDALIRMSFVTRKEMMIRALSIAQTFKPTPKGVYRSALM